MEKKLIAAMHMTDVVVPDIEPEHLEQARKAMRERLDLMFFGALVRLPPAEPTVFTWPPRKDPMAYHPTDTRTWRMINS